MKKISKWTGRYLMAFLLLGFFFWGTQSLEGRAAIVSTDHQKYTYGELKEDLKKLEKKYEEHCQVNVIGKSADNRNLYEVVLGNPEAKRHLLVIGNLHAREYMTTQLCMKQIEYYLSDYEKKVNGTKISKVLDKVAIHYVPSCNPDGTAISQSGFGAIRDKDLRRQLYRMPGSSRTWKANARGVDLNRNWDASFRRGGRRGYAGYHGTKAASEPEVKVLVKWLNEIEDTGKVVGVVSYHSTGSIIYGRCASNATGKVKEQTTRMYRVAQSLTGYRLMPAESLRSAGGCSREYFLYKKKIPCITLEVGRRPCPLSIGEFSSIWKKNKDVVIKEAMLFD
ncbi:MAG: M14 family zinc carboxypeptidase [Eubacteriales bacterium]|nr:M14 family zinc carboxypeptidase [Eubacteriales bacterium]